MLRGDLSSPHSRNLPLGGLVGTVEQTRDPLRSNPAMVPSKFDVELFLPADERNPDSLPKQFKPWCFGNPRNCGHSSLPSIPMDSGVGHNGSSLVNDLTQADTNLTGTLTVHQLLRLPHGGLDVFMRGLCDQLGDTSDDLGMLAGSDEHGDDLNEQGQIGLIERVGVLHADLPARIIAAAPAERKSRLPHPDGGRSIPNPERLAP